MLVFQVDLFPAKGDMPHTIMDVASREKDIRYSSRTRQVTDQLMRLRQEREIIRKVLKKLPDELEDDPDVSRLRELSAERAVNVQPCAARRARVGDRSDRIERAGVDVAGLRADDRRPVSPAQRGGAARAPSGATVALGVRRADLQPEHAAQVLGVQGIRSRGGRLAGGGIGVGRHWHTSSCRWEKCDSHHDD